MINVLIVEDDYNKKDLIYRTLIETSVIKENIIHVDNIVDAIKTLSAHSFDILILDLKLPVKKGQRPKHDSGVRILKAFDGGDLFVPSSVLGLTSYNDLREQHLEEFKMLDFSLHDITNSDDWMESLSHKVKWLNQSKKKFQIVENKKVIISVHGINTMGVWQDKLNSIFESETDFIAKDWKYTNKSFFKLIYPKWRRKIVEKFIEDLNALFREHPNCDFYFFSHSFGTYLVAQALQKGLHINTPNIKLVVLAGSVLKRDFQWNKIRKELNIPYIINDCGVRDKPLIISHLFLPGLGMAGRSGFYSFKDDKIINRFFDGGHSFFSEENEFYQRYWAPLLNESPQIVCSSAKQNETIEKVLDAMSPIVLIVSLFFLVALSFYFLG